MTTGLIKIALKREAGYPIGQPAPLYANCPCGTTISHLDYKTGFTCPNCRNQYSADGWIISRPVKHQATVIVDWEAK